MLAALMLLGVGGVGAEEALTDETATGVLVAPKTKVTLHIGDDISWAKLLKGTTWGIRDLNIQAENGYPPTKYSGSVLDNRSRGTYKFRVTAPDGEWVEITIRVKFTAWQWFKYYILSGWFLDWFDNWLDKNEDWEYLALALLFPILVPLLIIHGYADFSIW